MHEDTSSAGPAPAPAVLTDTLEPTSIDSDEVSPDGLRPMPSHSGNGDGNRGSLYVDAPSIDDADRRTGSPHLSHGSRSLSRGASALSSEDTGSSFLGFSVDDAEDDAAPSPTSAGSPSARDMHGPPVRLYALGRGKLVDLLFADECPVSGTSRHTHGDALTASPLSDLRRSPACLASVADRAIWLWGVNPEVAKVQVFKGEKECYNVGASSLWCLQPYSKARVHAFDVINSTWFETATLVVIILNTITLAMDIPETKDESGIQSFLLVSEYIFQSLFTLEMLVKIGALGFVLHPHSYLRTGWNRIDFLVVVAGYIGFFVGSNVTVLRLVRVVRPLRTISRVSGMRTIMNTIMDAIPTLLEIFVLVLFLMVIYAIMGMGLFSGKWHHRCHVATGTPPFSFGVVQNDTDICGAGRACCADANGVNLPQACLRNDNVYYDEVYNFDHIVSAMLLVFKVISLDDWPDDMHKAQNASGFWACVYFLSLVLVGSYFCINLVLATLSSVFAEFAEAEVIDGIQLGHILLQYKGQAIDTKNCVVTNPGGDNAGTGNALHVLDPDPATKWLDYNVCELHFQFPASVKVDSYMLSTAKDAPQCDPVNWVFEGFSKISGEWDELHATEQDYPVPLARNQETPFFHVKVPKPYNRYRFVWFKRRMDVGEDELMIQEGLSFRRQSTGQRRKSDEHSRRGRRGMHAHVLSFRSADGDGGVRDDVTEGSVRSVESSGSSVDEREGSAPTALQRVAEHAVFGYVMLFFTMLNVVCMACDHHGVEDNHSLNTALNAINFWCTVVFTLELFFKLVALGARRYFSDNYNVFDCVLVLASLPDVIQTIVEWKYGSGVSGAMSAFRVCRLARMAREVSGLRLVLETTLKSIMSVTYLFLIMLLVIFIYSILGLQLFHTAFPEPPQRAPSDYDAEERSNFESLPQSLLTVFVVITGESWCSLMRAGIVSTTWAAGLYFVTLFLLGNYLLLNLVIAIVIFNFSEASGRGADEREDKKRHAEMEQERQRAAVLDKFKNNFIEQQRRQTRTSLSHRPSVASSRAQETLNEDLRILSEAADAERVRRHSHVSTCRRFSTRSTRGGIRVQASPAAGVKPSSPLRVDGSLGGTPRSPACGDGMGKSPVSFVERKPRSPLSFVERKPRSPLSFVERKPRSPVSFTGSGGTFPRSPLSPPDLHSAAGPRFAESDVVPPAALPVPAADDVLQVEDSMLAEGARSEVDRGSVNSHSRATSSVADRTDLRHLTVTFNSEASDARKTSQLSNALVGGKEPRRLLSLALPDLRPALALAAGRRESEPPVVGKSFGYFTVHHPARRLAAEIVLHKYFNWLIIFIIAVNVVFLALDNPSLDHKPGLQSAVAVADIVFTALFTVEALLKMFALGVYHPSEVIEREQEATAVPLRGGYLNDPWNCIDMFVCVTALAGLGYKPFRLLRSLRAIRFLILSQAVRMVVLSVIVALPQIAYVLLVCSFIWLVFAILGVALFKGQYYYCTDLAVGDKANCTGLYEYTYDEWGGEGTELLPREWVRTRYHFDNVGAAMLTLLEIAIGEGWAEIMYTGIDTSGSSNRALSLNQRKPTALYFVGFMIVGGFFAINLFIGALVEQFSQVKSEMDGSATLTDAQRDWVDACKIMHRTQIYKIPNLQYSNPVLAWVSRLVRHRYFEHGVMVMILLNVLAMALQRDDQSDAQTEALGIIFVVFNVLYAVEAALKILGFGPSVYFADNWCRFDFLVVVVSLILMGLSLGAHFASALRIFKMFRLVKRAKSLQKLFRTLIYAIPSLSNIAAILVVVFFIFGVIGVSLFGRISLDDNPGLTPHANFRDLGHAIVLLFTIATTEAWTSVMDGCMVTPSNSGCSNAADCGVNCCGTDWALVYFIAFMIIGSFVAVNLFVTVLLDQFLMEDKLNNEPMVLHADLFARFRDLWVRFDPSASESVPANVFVGILRNLTHQQLKQLGHTVQTSRAKSLGEQHFLLFLAKLNVPLKVLDTPDDKGYRVHVSYREAQRAMAMQLLKLDADDVALAEEVSGKAFIEDRASSSDAEVFYVHHLIAFKKVIRGIRGLVRLRKAQAARARRRQSTASNMPLRRASGDTAARSTYNTIATSARRPSEGSASGDPPDARQPVNPLVAPHTGDAATQPQRETPRSSVGHTDSLPESETRPRDGGGSMPGSDACGSLPKPHAASHTTPPEGDGGA